MGAEESTAGLTSDVSADPPKKIFLRASSGMIPTHHEDNFNKLYQEASFTPQQLEEIMKHFESKGYEYGLTKEEFDEVAEKLNLFPEASSFTKEYVRDSFFEMFDADKDGAVSYFEFIHAASILMSGTFEEKAEMLFKLHDHNNDGKITRNELFNSLKKSLESAEKIVRANFKKMAAFMGSDTFLHHPAYAEKKPVTDEEVIQLVDKYFLLADSNHDQIISKEEFIEWAKTSSDLKQQMEALGLSV